MFQAAVLLGAVLFSQVDCTAQMDLIRSSESESCASSASVLADTRRRSYEPLLLSRMALCSLKRMISTC